MNINVFVLIALSYISCLLAEVTVVKRRQVLYDESPELRIRGSGFDVNEHKISLTLGTRGLPPLILDKDYLINVDKDGSGLILKLRSNRKWADFADRVPPVALVLSSVKFEGSDSNLLHEDVIVANIQPIPTIKDNPDYVMHKSGTNEFRIDGTGFTGAKKVDLYFDPPLIKEVSYEDISPYPLTKNQVVLRLRHGYNWRETLGLLKVIGVDTGGGPVKVNGEEGVVVAQVVDRPDTRTGALNNANTMNPQQGNNKEPDLDTLSRATDTLSFMEEWTEKMEAVHQAHQQLQALVETYEQKFQDREKALQVREQQLQKKEHDIKEQEKGLQERIRALELQFQKQGRT